MPTNRTRRTRKHKPSTISESMRHYLLTGEYGAHTCPDCSEIGETFLLANPGRRDELLKIWKSHEDEILSDWIKENPCSRPWIFWLFETTENRQQIGGKGETEWEKYPAIVPYYTKGIPASWTWIDEKSPPCFESEATYLQRNGLLTESEKRYLTKHPKLLQPEKVEFENDKND